MNEGCEAEPRVWRYPRWDSFTCAKMKEGIVVGCLLKVSAMASDDEGFALSVTSNQAHSGSSRRSDTLQAQMQEMRE